MLQQERLAGEALGTALRASGLSVEVVGSSWPAMLENPAMPVDVAVIDLHVDDGILGSTRVQKLRELGIATVVVGADPQTAAVASVLRAGALGFVATSDPLADLVAAVRAAAAGKRQTDLPSASAAVDPGLGKQEERALVLYASGRSIREVANDMRTTEETIKSYIKRGRRKFRDIGVDIGTRVLLRAHARREGWLSHK